MTRATDVMLGFAGAFCLLLLAGALLLLVAGSVTAFRQGRAGEGLLFGAGVISGVALTVGLIVGVAG